MGQLAKWLLHEDQKEFFDYVFAVALNAVFLVLVALLLWPMGRTTMALTFAKGYWIFWTAVIVTACVLAIHDTATGASIWIAIILYAIGVVSCWVACVIVAAFYMGSIYRMVNLALAALSFIAFSVWPNAGSAMYGWFFNLFW
jgi:hypothetical protein